MTLEEFQSFCEQKIEEGKETEKRLLEQMKKLEESRRTYGFNRNFIKEEDGHWIVVKNNSVVMHCDTKAQAWNELHSN